MIKQYFIKSIIMLVLSQADLIIVFANVLFPGLKEFLSTTDSKYRSDEIFVKIAPLQILFFGFAIYYFVKSHSAGIPKWVLLIFIVLGGIWVLLSSLFIYALITTPESALHQGW